MLRQKEKRENWWIKGVFLVLIWSLTWSLYKDFSKVRKGYERVDESNRRLAEEERDNKILTERMMMVESEYYKEKVIREKLNMQLPGETVVVLPELKINEDERGEEAEADKPNWEKWVDLIK